MLGFVSLNPTLCQFDCAMRNSTMADFRIEPENYKFTPLSFLLRSNWPFFWPAAALTPETASLKYC